MPWQAVTVTAPLGQEYTRKQHMGHFLASGGERHCLYEAESDHMFAGKNVALVQEMDWVVLKLV
jgi:hypothetical protein